MPPCLSRASTSVSSGYRDALAAAGIPFDERLVCYGDNHDAGTGFATDDELARSSQSHRPPYSSRVMCSLSPRLAAIRQHGLRIPDDIAVVGFDDNPFSEYAYPPLTTVYLPFEEMGRQAGKMLLDLLLHPDEPKREVLLEGQLIVRESSSKRL